MSDKVRFEVRQLDSWGNSEDGWEVNTSYLMGEMVTGAQDEKRAISAWLKRHCGISFLPNRTRFEYDGDCWTIVDRKSGEPLMVAIPMGG